VTTVPVVGLGAFGWRHRDSPGVRWFVALEATAAVWVLLTIWGLLTPPGGLRLRLWGIGIGLSVLTLVLWFGFIVAYTGHREWLDPKRFLPAATPLLACTLLYVLVPTWPPLVGDVTQLRVSVGVVVDASVGPVGAILGLYLYATFIGGFLLALQTVFESESLVRGQVLAFVVGTSVPVVASALRTLGLGPPGFPITQVGLGVQSVFWGYAVFRQQFLRQVLSVSRIGERRAFETLEDGVRFVVSDDGPGIPPSELEPVREGEESSLRHSSGLGLWVVNWGAQTLRADLSFDVDDGPTVTPSIPETPVSNCTTQIRQPE